MTQKEFSLQNVESVDCLALDFGGTSIAAVFGQKHIDKESGKVVNFKLLGEPKIFATRDPASTIKEVTDYVKASNLDFQHLGIASFGPLCLNPDDAEYGNITTTPKVHWQNVPLLREIKSALSFNEGSTGFDTDVNAGALAEFVLGNHNVKNCLVFICIGTGIGIGIVANGKCVHGMMHPEGGHMIIPKLEEEKDFKGVCAFHGDCLEGLVTNWSIAKRFGITDVEKLRDLADEDPVWQKIGHYLAVCCANIGYILSPEVIVLAGGVMKRTILYDIIRKEIPKLFNGYQVLYKKTVEEFIQPPKLGDDVNLIGAMLL